MKISLIPENSVSKNLLNRSLEGKEKNAKRGEVTQIYPRR
jgi:hypothetical protein